MVNPPFRVDGPPYPRNLSFFQTEALAWFSDNTERSLPWHTNAESVELVKRFYGAGAVRVDVVVESADQSTPFINELEVFPPVDDVEKRTKLIVMARTESQLETQPHMENKDISDEIRREDAAFARDSSPDPIVVSWEVT